MMPVTSAIEPLRLANRQAEGTLCLDHALGRRPAGQGIERAADHGRRRFRRHPRTCPGAALRRPRRPAPYGSSADQLAAPRERRGATSARCVPARMSWPRTACSTAIAAPSTGRTCPGFVEAFPELHVDLVSLFEIDRDRFTCAGGTSALDMMLRRSPATWRRVRRRGRRTIHRRRSAAPASASACRCGRGWAPAIPSCRRHDQRSKISRSRCRQACWPSAPACPRRQLERLFRRYLDRSPKRYLPRAAARRARSLLLQTEMSVINVALACGFSSPSHFSKCYRAFYGRTPYRERGLPALETGAAA